MTPRYLSSTVTSSYLATSPQEVTDEAKNAKALEMDQKNSYRVNIFMSKTKKTIRMPSVSECRP